MPGAACPALLHRGAPAPLHVYTLLLVCTAPLLICCATRGSDKSWLGHSELLLLCCSLLEERRCWAWPGAGLQSPSSHPIAVPCRSVFVGEAARCCACSPGCPHSWGCCCGVKQQHLQDPHGLSAAGLRGPCCVLWQHAEHGTAPICSCKQCSGQGSPLSHQTPFPPQCCYAFPIPTRPDQLCRAAGARVPYMKVVVVVASPCAVPGKETANGDLVVSTQLLELPLPLGGLLLPFGFWGDVCTCVGWG